MQLPARRTALKWLHWIMVPLFVWFLLVQPDDVTPFGPRAFQAHSTLALIFVSLSLLWFADLMRRGLERRMLFSALLDVLGAGAAFFCMGIGLMVVLAISRDAYGQPIFDLDSIFADIRADPGAYWWLYICLLSTLVPTLAHIAFATFGALVQGWPGLRRFIVEGLDAAGRGDEILGRWATRVLTLTMTVSIMLPVLIVGGLLQHQAYLGNGLLTAFEAIARLIGLIA